MQTSVPAFRTRRLARLLGICGIAIGLTSPLPVWAADSFTPAQRSEIVKILREALVRDPSILRDAVEALQLAERRNEDEATQAALAANKGALIDPTDPVGGNPQGDVTIVEFFDVHCSFCKRLEGPMAELLRRDGKVRLVYKDLPVLGAPSVLAAKALLAAQRQGGYEKLRDALMRSNAPTTRDSLRAETERAGLDWARLSTDMGDPQIAARIQNNLHLASALGIRGTPAMVVGDQMIPGAVDLPELQRLVAAARKK